jgi:hypothetical protein
MNGKSASFVWFGLGAAFAVSLISIGAQKGPLKKVFAAPQVVMPTPGLHAFAPPACTNGDLKGNFGFYRIGATDVVSAATSTLPAGPFSNPLAAVGIMSFDGAGNGASYQRQDRQGSLKPLAPVLNLPNRQINSTPEKFFYSVSADCTFLTYNVKITGNKSVVQEADYIAQGVILGNEDEFYMLSMTPPGSAVVVVGKKLPMNASVTF